MITFAAAFSSSTGGLAVRSRSTANLTYGTTAAPTALQEARAEAGLGDEPAPAVQQRKVEKVGDQQAVLYRPKSTSRLGWAVIGNGHNGYLDVWLELGFIGLGLFLLMFFTALKRAYSRRSRVSARQSSTPTTTPRRARAA